MSVSLVSVNRADFPIGCNIAVIATILSKKANRKSSWISHNVLLPYKYKKHSIKTVWHTNIENRTGRNCWHLISKRCQTEYWLLSVQLKHQSFLVKMSYVPLVFFLRPCLHWPGVMSHQRHAGKTQKRPLCTRGNALVPSSDQNTSVTPCSGV